MCSFFLNTNIRVSMYKKHTFQFLFPFLFFFFFSIFHFHNKKFLMHHPKRKYNVPIWEWVDKCAEAHENKMY